MKVIMLVYVKEWYPDLGNAVVINLAGLPFIVLSDDLTFSHVDNDVKWYHWYSSEDTEVVG